MEEMNRETVFTSDCVPRWSLPTTNHSSMSSSPLKSNSTPYDQEHLEYHEKLHLSRIPIPGMYYLFFNFMEMFVMKC